MSKAFLGGTCNSTDWRDKLIPLLEIDYFNPVITDREWTEEDRLNEIKQRKEADFVVYVFTPRMTGLYSIAEVIDDSNKRPQNTILFIQERDVNDEGKAVVFTKSVQKSMQAIAHLAEANGAYVCNSLAEIAKYLNKHK